MKRRRTFLIIWSIAIIAALGFIIFTNANQSGNSTGKELKIKARDLESITLINNGKGKAITKVEDIKAVCDVINEIDMAIIENWNGHFERIGGPSYLFWFNYSSGAKKEIGYYDGSYLIVDGIAYSIHSIELEKFWLLDYTTHKWNYKDNMFETVD